MPLDGTEINKPSLRTVWTTAKDKAEKAAGKAKEDAKYKLLDKSFKAELGPDLDSWFKPWPDLAKITKGKTELEKTVVAYKKLVKEAGLGTPIAKLLTDALTEIGSALDERLGQAELYIEAENDPGLAETIKNSNKKSLTPIVLFAKHDVAKDVANLAKDAAGKIQVDSIVIEMVLDDPKVLAAAPDDEKDYSGLAKQMYSAADRDRIVKEMAEALNTIAKTIKSPSDQSKAQTDFDKEIDKILEAAGKRAGEVFIRLAKDKVSAVKYKVAKTAKITLLVGGLALSIAALASAPFSGGAHAVFAIAGILRTARELYNTIGKLAMAVEKLAALLAADIKELADHYAKASENRMGSEEFGKELINAFWPEGTNTIGVCKTNSGELKSQVSNLNVKANETSDQLDEAMKKQREANAEVKAFTEAGKGVFSPAETKRVVKLIQSEAALAKTIQELVDSTEKLLVRVGKMQKAHEGLHKAVEALASRQPTWSAILIVVSKIAVSAGFLVGGGVGAPEGFDVIKEAHAGIEHTTQALESFAAAKEAAEDMKDIIKAKFKSPVPSGGGRPPPPRRGGRPGPIYPPMRSMPPI